jgi:peptidoglycan hydrolase CwlO-like protein
MTETIIVALISSGATLAVCLINNSFQAKKARQQHEKESAEIKAQHNETISLIQYRIEELTREVREHNNFAKRMPVVEEQIKVINHRITDLENKE